MAGPIVPGLPQPLGLPNGIAKPIPGQIGLWAVWSVGDAAGSTPALPPITPVPPPTPTPRGGVLPLVTGQISPGTGPWLMADPSGQCIGVPLS